jgi:hypothetical protein
VKTSGWSGAGSNRRPSAFQVNRAKRCADLEKRTSLTSGTALGGRCETHANSARQALSTYAVQRSAIRRRDTPESRHADTQDHLDRVTSSGIISRAMSSPCDIERKRLDFIANELREAFHERGHRVDVALEADQAFGSGRSRSSLMRDLVLDVVSRAASEVGDIGFQPVNGPGHELVGARHRYRIRKAKRDSEDNLVVEVSSDSSLGLEEEPTLYPLENWIFGWIPNNEGLIAEVIAAKVLGVRPGSPGRLILGNEIPLGSSGPVGGGFTPSDEGLDLGLDEKSEDGESGLGA